MFAEITCAIGCCSYFWGRDNSYAQVTSSWPPLCYSMQSRRDPGFFKTRNREQSMSKKRKNTAQVQSLSTARKPPLSWSGLQARMAFSYVWVTVACILLVEMMIGGPVLLLRIFLGESDPRNPPLVLLGGFGLAFLASGAALALLAAPIGGIFGLVTTRSLVRRLRKLATVATLFADGDYEQRVHVTRRDEIGQLEQQFNRMAQQLAESMGHREVLAEQNARLAERSRISRELHDAISQDLFSLRMLVGGLHTA